MSTSNTFAAAVFEQLDEADIRRRLEELAAERKALLVLLRAARAKRKAKPAEVPLA